MAHILVVDDDEIIRMLLVEILQKAGHTVMEAENGQMGLERIAARSADLVITDIFMPQMDGIDLLAILSRDYPRCRIIAISGGYKAMNSQLSLKMAQAFGAVDIITKPFQVSTVISKVEQALRAKDQQDS